MVKRQRQFFLNDCKYLIIATKDLFCLFLNTKCSMNKLRSQELNKSSLRMNTISILVTSDTRLLTDVREKKLWTVDDISASSTSFILTNVKWFFLDGETRD